MSKFEKIKKVWNIIVSEWKTRYRLVFSNEDTHEQSFVIRRITIQKMAVVAILATFIIIVLTTILIALTPLRVYIPGYTDQKDYKLYKQTAARVDSLEKQLALNQEFISNFTKMLEGDDGTVYEDDDATMTPDVHPAERDPSRKEGIQEVMEEAEMILGRVGPDNFFTPHYMLSTVSLSYFLLERLCSFLYLTPILHYAVLCKTVYKLF